ncbi:unnamed protein product [Rhizoctonia solani]|uniref:Uncharacterized protein n=1 Tax=Rhizoctonia solani TaxID=456999 RepID=A0A8H2XS06_9AGAM|nr:unnamed protein product [Rhizoctonia solani]
MIGRLIDIVHTRINTLPKDPPDPACKKKHVRHQKPIKRAPLGSDRDLKGDISDPDYYPGVDPDSELSGSEFESEPFESKDLSHKINGNQSAMDSGNALTSVSKSRESKKRKGGNKERKERSKWHKASSDEQLRLREAETSGASDSESGSSLESENGSDDDKSGSKPGPKDIVRQWAVSNFQEPLSENRMLPGALASTYMRS